MRIWSISPKYLDTKGLVALWRETLLAKNVLAGNTRGYRNHPQLERFKLLEQPLLAVDKYLEAVFAEAVARNYKFDAAKFERNGFDLRLPVTTGQVDYELGHLRNKLVARAPERAALLPATASDIEVVPLFEVVPGEIESWEIV
jgi:hypothetical protein